VPPWWLNPFTAPETAFDVDATVELVLLAELPVIVAFVLIMSLERTVLVGVMTVPKGTVWVNPTATFAETLVEFSQAFEAGGVAGPAT
jgi:hypothetical protein